jgi:hypothetical protein
MVIPYLKRGVKWCRSLGRWSGRLLPAVALAATQGWAEPAPPTESGGAPAAAGAPLARPRRASDAAPTRLAEVAKDSLAARPVTPVEPVTRAKRAIADCQERYRYIHDYTCTFVKRERVDGRLTPEHIMAMKARTSPKSIYFKFHQPNQGREAIYVQGRNRDRVVAHDVGLTRLIAGTMHLDPRGSMAMEDNRHPVTEAGIGTLIDTVARHWAVELTPAESVLTFHEGAQVAKRPCMMIESVHPQRAPNFLFHKVRLYIDREYGLPIRFEAYDWPRQPGAAPELVEEYIYLDLKLNVGLHDSDFDPANSQYSFGRF